MSYLRGSLTRDEIARLTGDTEDGKGAEGDARRADDGDPERADPEAATVLAAAGVADESPVAPDVADGIAIRFLDPAAPWADDIGADPTGRRLEAAVAARVHLLFDDRYAEVDHREEWEAVFFPLQEGFDPDTGIAVDYDDRDLRSEPPEGARYALPTAPLAKTSWWRDAENALEDHLHRERAVHVLKNTELGIYSRVGESGSDFRRRCERMAQDDANEETAKLRDRYESRFRKARDQRARAQARVRELEADVQSRQHQELVEGAGRLLSAFLGGRRSARSLSSIASRRSTTRRTEERLRTATERVTGKSARWRHSKTSSPKISPTSRRAPGNA